ncbi:MAG: alginate export family protein [Phenylobacterium sp.]|uniref:alginate export family protein n=1 Tax=Phenylobacterium sp. TaxID=1871053 RepID=UPI002733E39C|nr:alginate export family protein [Phenylobacterium sp.]MDP3172827.1 alginate export family protein [Phenylobacterium sp.]
MRGSMTLAVLRSVGLAWFVAAVVVAGPVAAQTAPPAGAGLSPQAEAALRTLRYHREDEDWRWLKRGARTPDAWDRFEYIPLGNGASLSIGADLRAYYEGFRNENFGVGLAENRYFQNRALVHANLRINDNLRIFTQLQSEGVTNRKGGPRRTIDRNDLDVNQAFVETAVPGGVLRLGRQELRLGVGRILSTRDGVLNVRQPLDGARLILRNKAGRLDAFVFHQVLTTPDAFDDRSKGQPYWWGVQAQRAQPTPRDLGVELYLLGYDAQRATYYDGGVGQERRRTLGGRVFINRDGWDSDAEANYQFGTFRGNRIEAWSADWEAGYTFRDRPWKPRLGWAFTANSGDKAIGDGELNSFRPFVARHPWGQLAPFGLTNIEGVQAVANLQPRSNLRLTARRYWVRRQQDAEGIYAGGYAPLRPGSPAQSRDIGSQTELAAEYDVTRHLKLSLFLTHVEAGRYIRQGPGGKDIDYTAAILQYRF